MKQHRVKFETLGCKLNFAESATIGKLLADKGVPTAKADEQPDICIVNTCSVTELADKKCRQQIRSLNKRHPNALMVVTGCYAQLKSEEISEIEGVDIVLGSEQKLDIVDHVQHWIEHGRTQTNIEVTPTKEIRKFSPSCEAGGRTRYWLKVQDGCDYYCTYCTIPFARGRSRSGTIASLVEQAEQVAAEGGREIVLTGVNIGQFGKDNSETLLDLLRGLDGVSGIERYRISSMEPELLTHEIIDFCAHSRAFMPHFHIPLQSGNDEVLRLMHRQYERSVFADRIAYIRQLRPESFVGVDVMVGSRGETDLRFEDSLEFIRSLDVQHLHVFPYSERPGTRALSIPHIVPQKVKTERVQRMMELSQSKELEFARRFVGTVRPVLFEQAPDGHTTMHGFTDNYIKVTAKRDDRLVNRVTPVRIVAVDDDLNVTAEVIN